MQRQISFGANPPYYEGILGAPACEQHPSRCNLSGIITDDAAGTIMFRLSQPDPDFLYKLALPLTSPAPPGAPTHTIIRAPFLPGTGPYTISQFTPGKTLTLARNPYFRQWSYAAPHRLPRCHPVRACDQRQCAGNRRSSPAGPT